VFFDASLNAFLYILGGRCDLLADVVGFLISGWLVAVAGIAGCFLDRAPSLLSVAFDLLRGAFVGEVLIVDGLTGSLFYFAGGFVVHAFDFGLTGAHDDCSFAGLAEARDVTLRPIRFDPALYASTARKQVEDENDECEYQQEMNPSPYGIDAYNAEKPENDENNGDRPKHGDISIDEFFTMARWFMRSLLPRRSMLDAAATGEEVENQNDDGENKQDVDKSTADMEGEAEKP